MDSDVVLKILLVGACLDSLIILLPYGVDDTDRLFFINEITPSISISVNGRSPFSLKNEASFAFETFGSSSSSFSSLFNPSNVLFAVV